jgi:hypothetical protein
MDERVTYRCTLCNTILPFGPSNDDSPYVQIEIRAAEIIADNYALWTEQLGFDSADDIEEPGGNRENHPSWHAGYIARIIAEHGDEP